MPDEPVLLVGAGGLIGSSVRQTFVGRPVLAPRLSWTVRASLESELSLAVERLCETGNSWSLYWCAGRGHPGATTEVLEADLAAVALLREVLSRAPLKAAVRIVHASSAGGLYAQQRESPYSEADPVCPTGDYGFTKQCEERLLDELAEEKEEIRVVHARLSSVYGPGQAVNKRQGVISILIRNSLAQRPTRIFVPLDTARDYVHREADRDRS